LDVFFQLIAGFSLFFGIAGLVYSTEVSKRYQALIDNRFDAVETELARKIHRQDKAIAEAVHAMRQVMAKSDDMAHAQTIEINALRRAMEPLVMDLEKRVAEQKLMSTAGRGR
jgi:hypothetical protein